MVNVIQHIPRFIRQWVFDLISHEIDLIDPSEVALDFQAIKTFILARLAALFHL